MNYRSFEDLSTLVLNNISKVPMDIDLIVGVPRSGLLVANIIALLMNKSLTDIEGLFENRIIAPGKTKEGNHFISDVDSCKKILIVEDSVATGHSIEMCKKKLSSLDKKFDFVFLAAYVVPEKSDSVDIYFEVLSSPRLFEWNIFHHTSFIPNSCFDIDGVLCEDPSAEENDDGEKYREFILNAPTKLIPTCKIGYIVTSRLEKYRNETEKWLKDNNINYSRLIMLNATAKERVEQNLHASFKAKVYKKLNDSLLFIESEERQAIEICNLTGKPVYCIGNNKFYNGDKKYIFKYETTSKIRRILKKLKIMRIIYYSIKKMKANKNI